MMLVGMTKATRQHLLDTHHLLEGAMVKDTIQIEMIPLMGDEVITIHQQDHLFTDQKVAGDANTMVMPSCMSYSIHKT